MLQKKILQYVIKVAVQRGVEFLHDVGSTLWIFHILVTMVSACDRHIPKTLLN